MPRPYANPGSHPPLTPASRSSQVEIEHLANDAIAYRLNGGPLRVISPAPTVSTTFSASSAPSWTSNPARRRRSKVSHAWNENCTKTSSPMNRNASIERTPCFMHPRIRRPWSASAMSAGASAWARIRIVTPLPEEFLPYLSVLSGSLQFAVPLTRYRLQFETRFRPSPNGWRSTFNFT